MHHGFIRLLAPACIAVVCVILTLGLWPFHTPANEVTWSKEGDGVVLGQWATILGSGLLDRSSSDGVTIEIWAQPDRRTSGTLLSLYRKDVVLFTVDQSLDDLRVDLDRTVGPAENKHFYVGDAFGPSLRRKAPVFLSIISGSAGTHVYLNGTLSMTASNFSIPPEALSGRLIVADSPGQCDSFRGTLLGLAIYGSELSADEVSRHYETWTRNGQPVIEPSEHNIALYLFNEGRGKIIRNLASTSGDLEIPEKYIVVDKIVLEPFWREFNFSRGYWSGNLKNIVGFVPVGFFFYAYFLIARPTWRPVLITIAFGTLLSIAIEVLQVFLPTRDSGTTDIITNTFGTWLGVLLYRQTYAYLVQTLPGLGSLTFTAATPEASLKRPPNCSS